MNFTQNEIEFRSFHCGVNFDCSLFKTKYPTKNCSFNGIVKHVTIVRNNPRRHRLN